MQLPKLYRNSYLHTCLTSFMWPRSDQHYFHPDVSVSVSQTAHMEPFTYVNTSYSANPTVYPASMYFSTPLTYVNDSMVCSLGYVNRVYPEEKVTLMPNDHSTENPYVPSDVYPPFRPIPAFQSHMNPIHTQVSTPHPYCSHYACSLQTTVNYFEELSPFCLRVVLPPHLVNCFAAADVSPCPPLDCYEVRQVEATTKKLFVAQARRGIGTRAIFCLVHSLTGVEPALVYAMHGRSDGQFFVHVHTSDQVRRIISLHKAVMSDTLCFWYARNEEERNQLNFFEIARRPRLHPNWHKVKLPMHPMVFELSC